MCARRTTTDAKKTNGRAAVEKQIKLIIEKLINIKKTTISKNTLYQKIK